MTEILQAAKVSHRHLIAVICAAGGGKTAISGDAEVSGSNQPGCDETRQIDEGLPGVAAAGFVVSETIGGSDSGHCGELTDRAAFARGLGAARHAWSRDPTAPVPILRMRVDPRVAE